jgi:hypothetical protein
MLALPVLTADSREDEEERKNLRAVTVDGSDVALADSVPDADACAQKHEH